MSFILLSFLYQNGGAALLVCLWRIDFYFPHAAEDSSVFESILFTGLKLIVRHKNKNHLSKRFRGVQVINRLVYNKDCFMKPLYAGKILTINLSSREVSYIDTVRYSGRFLGGRGTATALYYDMVPPEAGAFGPENCLIVSLGPLAGIPGGLGTSRWGIYAKSPLPAVTHHGREHFCYGSLGGTFGSELRFAGYDGMVITGISEEPVYLLIENEKVLFQPAGHLWGKTTGDTIKFLAGETPERSRFMTIGPAGENRVPSATVLASGGASCSGGMGAVMGAKNLKAVAVRGTACRKVEVADRDALKAIEKNIRSYNRGNVKVWGLDFMARGGKTKRSPCFGCMAHCLRVTCTADDGTTGKFMCQSRFFYMHHAWGYYSEENDVPFFANRLCDDYGIDTWEVQSLIEWLLLCHGKGILKETEGLPDVSTVGSLQFIRELVEMTSLKKGMGEVLSQGAWAAGRALGGGAEEVYTRTDPYDPRYCTVNALLFPFETREPIQQLHEAGLVLSQWSSHAKGVPEAHISSDVVRGIARRFWGSEEAGDMTTWKGKALAAKRIQERQLAKECAGYCDWAFPIIDIPVGEDHVGDPAFESRILSAASGVDCSENDFYLLGERVFNLQRAILLREGHRARDEDFLPDEWHDRPLETHVADPECIVPGKKGRVTSQVGRKVDRDAYLAIRDDFYRLRGWDVPTGLQPIAHLEDLDLGYVARDMHAAGLARHKARGISFSVRARRLAGRVYSVAGSFVSRPKAGERYPFLEGQSLTVEELTFILEGEVQKYGNEKIAHNFRNWTKEMQYCFTDVDTFFCISFIEGEAQQPVHLDTPLAKPEITYEMDSRVMKAMAEGVITGEEAYMKRLLRLKASFTDMMKLQSLKKV